MAKRAGKIIVNGKTRKRSSLHSNTRLSVLLARHTEEDRKHFEEQTDILKQQPTRADFEALQRNIEEGRKNLATKDDIAEVKDVWANVKKGANIASNTGKWTFRIMVGVGAFAAGWIAFKAIIIGIIHWALTSK